MGLPERGKLPVIPGSQELSWYLGLVVVMHAHSAFVSVFSSTKASAGVIFWSNTKNGMLRAEQHKQRNVKR